MTANEVIYHINQDKNLSDIWKQFSREDKEEIIRRMENQLPNETEKVMLEVKTGQNRLF
jgi:hypothetical protein